MSLYVDIEKELSSFKLRVNIDQKNGILGFLGESGSGKSMTLKCIAGLEKPTRGKIILNDRVLFDSEKMINIPTRERNVGFLFQNYALFPWKSVRDNVLYPMKQQKIPKEEREKKLEELIEMSDLKGKESMYPHQLSGGMKQRVAVIRALACNPEVLLMDEPLGAVDLKMRQNLQEELEKIWSANRITAVMVTHDVDEAVYMSDRVVIMSRNKGEIIGNIKIDIPRPRNRDCNEYEKYKSQVSEILSTCYDA